jgi:hypothetical protein
MQSYTASFTTDRTPDDIYRAITQPREWWFRAIEGDADRLGSVFYHQYQEVHHCVMKVTELVPGRKVVWHVVYNHFSFVKDDSEWNGTDLVFEIAKKGDRTELRFTHVGLVPASECYDVCADSWSAYIKTSLRDFIAKGIGEPGAIDAVVANAREQARTVQTS